MINNKYIMIVTGLITLIFSLSVYVSAAQVNATRAQYIISEVQISLIDPSEIETTLIKETIKTYNPQLSKEEQLEICNSIKDEASQTNFDPLFITSVIAAESSFEPEAISPCDARGLMQLTDPVVEIMQINNPYDVKQNIYAGTRYLEYLRMQFDEPDLILAAYNAGPTRVARLKRIPRISETINYIKKVTTVHQSLKDKFYTSLKDQILNPSFKPIEPSLCQNLLMNVGYYKNTSKTIIEIISCENRQRLLYSYSKA